MKGVLSKDVQESIRGLLITNENYSIALKILQEHYANKQVLIISYIESFVKLQPITSIKNVSGLRAMYDLVEGNLRNLSNLGGCSFSYILQIISSFVNRKNSA